MKVAASAVRGFTLLELLVVLALVAMSAALVGPQMYRWIERSEERAWQSELRAHLQALPLQAFETGARLVVDAVQLRRSVPSLPSTVDIVLVKPIVYSSTGAASGGQVELRFKGGRSEVWGIAPLTGIVSVARAAEG
ncbi:prepilin-type N-terminal cleavage/methylation domain-containing protein [Roseateles sp.]|jgi:prepilin-type N-terminal cleavage/methylation domain-containing protein|uniref:prepilin-type N-terminal cleavage/methylation domain-containing protein n=1 Tax=Roseateles sp. TaxID=1971397 RepID=UPI0037CB8C0A